MTPEEIDALTVGELRAIASRASETLEAFRRVQSLLGGSASAPGGGESTIPPATSEAEPPPEDAAAAHRRRQFQSVDAPSPNGIRFSASEIAERNRLMGRMRGPVDPDLPEEIAKMERGE